MKTWKLIAGIISMVFSGFVIFQSCAAGLFNALENNGETSGTAGIMVALLMITGGIISVKTRKYEKKGGNIALIIIMGFAAAVGFANYGSYGDLAIWSGWCLINAATAIIALIRSSGKKTESKRLEKTE